MEHMIGCILLGFVAGALVCWAGGNERRLWRRRRAAEPPHRHVHGCRTCGRRRRLVLDPQPPSEADEIAHLLRRAAER